MFRAGRLKLTRRRNAKSSQKLGNHQSPRGGEHKEQKRQATLDNDTETSILAYWRNTPTKRLYSKLFVVVAVGKTDQDS